jgi:hypothetical protein
MSEYWKSTPKYWCKYCKDYFKDTKFEKAAHEATPRHQGNIQRSLRTLHREKEQEDRQKQRAKDEVARLNGVVGGKSGSTSIPVAASVGKREAPKEASAEERKKQIKQLAEMGVVVPEEYRREMAMAGEWQTVSVTPVAEPSTGVLGPGSLAFGVRKRKMEEEAEEEAAEVAAAVKHKQWGSKFKTYPGKKSRLDEDGDDVEALLGGIITKDEPKDEEVDVKWEHGDNIPADSTEQPLDVAPTIKKEESLEEGAAPIKIEAQPLDPAVKMEDAAIAEEKPPGGGIVFKKRKPKIIRQT